MEIIVCDDIDKWDGPDESLAYFNLKTQQIHILNKEIMYNYVLKHEQIHANQKQKITQWLASLADFRPFIVLIGLVLTGVLMDFKPLVYVCSVIVLLLGLAYIYVEEIYPRRKMNENKLTQIKRTVF